MNNKNQTTTKSDKYSREYTSIRSEAESKWPAWKVSTYNVNFATTAHAKKVAQK